MCRRKNFGNGTVRRLDADLCRRTDVSIVLLHQRGYVDYTRCAHEFVIHLLREVTRLGRLDSRFYSTYSLYGKT